MLYLVCKITPSGRVSIALNTITMNTAPAELGNVALDNLAALQEGRQINAEHMAEAELRAMFNPAIVENHSFAVTSAKRDSFPYDEAILTVDSLLSMEAIGVDTSELLAKTGKNSIRDSVWKNETLLTKDLGNERLTIKDYGEGASFVLSSADPEHPLEQNAPSSVIKERVIARLKQSPAHQAMMEAGERLISGTVTPESVQTRAFNYVDDPLGTLVFLGDIGLSWSVNSVRRLRVGMQPSEVVEEALQNVAPHQAGRSDDGRTSVFTWGTSVKRELVVDRENGTFTFGVTQRPSDLYLERGNQSQEKSLPFVETDCARELCNFLDQAGLMLHPKVQREMMSGKEADRYGSIYTQLTREVAKWVNNPRRTRLSELFVPNDPSFKGRALQERGESALYDYANSQYDVETDTEQQTREQYRATSQSFEGEAAATLFGLMNGALNRSESPDGTHTTDLPVTKSSVHMTVGACFDVVAYYVGAAYGTRSGNPDYLKRVSVGEVLMLEKNTGSHTFLTTAPMTFNGVEMPKGALFTQGDDKQWAFLRLTPFAFDDAVDQLAFGSEISKMLKNEQEAMERIGELGMNALVNRATSAS
jgi:hypothetical protein